MITNITVLVFALYYCLSFYAAQGPFSFKGSGFSSFPVNYQELEKQIWNLICTIKNQCP